MTRQQLFTRACIALKRAGLRAPSAEGFYPSGDHTRALEYVERLEQQYPAPRRMTEGDAKMTTAERKKLARDLEATKREIANIKEQLRRQNDRSGFGRN